MFIVGLSVLIGTTTFEFMIDDDMCPKVADETYPRTGVARSPSTVMQGGKTCQGLVHDFGHFGANCEAEVVTSCREPVHNGLHNNLLPCSLPAFSTQSSAKRKSLVTVSFIFVTAYRCHGLYCFLSVMFIE